MRLRNVVISTAINISAIAIFAAIALSLQFPRLNQQLSGQTKATTVKEVRDEEARLKLIRQLPSRGLGFNNMIANFTFLQFLQYFGDDVSRNQFQTGYGLSPLYFANIIERDPRFLSSYIYMSASVSMFAGTPRAAIDIYSKGLNYLSPEQQSKAHLVWRYKATDQLLFLGDTKGARQSYLQAADWADRGSLIDKEISEDLKFIASLSRQSAQWLEQERDVSKAQIGAWSLVLQNATDKKTVETIAQELDKLGMKIEIKDGIQIIVPK
ncbi:hypothetical protein [Pseudanabaena mucicola]|uniref:Uncharacterized protein n=1 Tax=Pseudanabaena mucicola FACHB-723 TaxID=2692860 RepID=A0ABR7ZRK1_9CYAN|nr:hypothetical protein [Pseudanabaena mucicola]MBD2186578.1 hypothetical protein [Pseudanabaena mucicola FACHB-723]